MATKTKTIFKLVVTETFDNGNVTVSKLEGEATEAIRMNSFEQRPGHFKITIAAREPQMSREIQRAG